MNQSSDVSKIPLDVDINCDPVAENVWGFKKQADGTSVAEQQLVSNTGFHFSGGVASLHQNQYSDQNSPQYTYLTEGGNLIEIIPSGNDGISNAPINGVYLDGKLLDYVPSNGLESIQTIYGQYDDVIMTDIGYIGMKVLANQSGVFTPGTGATSWTYRTSTASPSGGLTTGWVDVVYGNGIYIAINNANSSSNIVQTSYDGLSWTARSISPTTSSASAGFRSIAYGNGLFVAIQGDTTGTNVVITSSDGINWSAVSSTPIPLSNGWQCITYGNGLFVVVGGNNSTNGSVMTSPNGITWTAQTCVRSTQSWSSVVYGSGLYVAVSSGNTFAGTPGYYQVMTSPDGITWTGRSSPQPDYTPAAYGWQSVTYGNNVFVAVAGSTSTSGAVMSSVDGITWTLRSIPVASSSSLNGWVKVTWGNGVFVAVSYGTTTSGVMMTSLDGTSWTAQTPNAPVSIGLGSICYGNGLFVTISTGTTSTSNVIQTSPVTSPSSSVTIRLDEISFSGIVTQYPTRTFSNIGYGWPIALVRQALNQTVPFSYANSTQYILVADSVSPTYTIISFDSAGVSGTKQLTTSIPVAFAGGKPKNLFAAKMVSLGAVATSAVDAGKAGYVVVSLGTAGNQTPSYLITNSAATSVAPFTNTNTAMKASWAVMQSKNGYNRVILTGQPNDSTANQTLIANIGYTFFTTAYTNAAVPTNAVTANADSTVVVSSSSYAFTDCIHTDGSNTHYFSGYAKPTTTYTPFTSQASSINPITGFGRLSLINETDNGGIKPPFEFRLVMSARSSSNGSTPQFISVGQPYSSDGVNVAIGTPISSFGEFDPTFGPQIGGAFNTVMWRWNQLYYIAKISVTPIRPIQKITSNLYKINTISPVNVVDVGAKQLLLGSNDYSSNFLLNGGTVGTAAWASSNIGWQSYSKTAGSSIDLGGLIVYNSAAQTVSPLAAFTPSCHQTGNYYNVNFYAGTGVTANTLQVAWRSDGRVLAAQTVGSPTSTTLPGLQNQSSGIGSTYISNTTSVPMPLGSRYSGYVIGANSSATSLAFNETYLSSGYQGTTITTEWDGYLLGNSVPLNAVTFSLFNQPYLFDGKSIYKVNLNGVNLSVPLTVLCRADGLSFLTTSQSQAFFSDPFDNSVWTFDGGFSLQKFKRLDGFGAIQNANFSAYDSAVTINTASAMVVLRDGLWISIPKSSIMIPDSYTGESYMRMYDTVNGTIFGNSFNWWQYQYYASSTVGTSTTNGILKTSSIVPLNYQTGYIGPDSNLRMVLSGITFAVYNEFKTATSLQVTIYGYDQDKAYTNPTRTFNIQPANYVNGGIFRAMIQPVQDRLLAASIKFVCNTGIRLYDLQYHWTEEAQANISPARSL
jgi:hypothetical protein